MRVKRTGKEFSSLGIEADMKVNLNWKIILYIAFSYVNFPKKKKKATGRMETC
jgi:hypothetical protein